MTLPLAKQLGHDPIDLFRSVPSCPACGATNGRTIGRPGPGWDTEFEGRVIRHPDYDVAHCATCGLYFKSQVLTNEALDDYYGVLPFESFESATLFPTDQLILSAIAPAGSGAKVLDFGCGVGRILETLTTRHRCYGVEVNKRACEVARSKGIKIVPESAVSNRTECDFDFVILSDVFEHLPNPLESLRKLVHVLKPGGALLISTGNGDAVRCREYLSQFWYFRAPGHLQMLSPKHLQWCAGQLSLELINCRISSHYSIPLKQRCGQYLRVWAFEQFHLKPHTWLTHMSRCIPRLRRAEHWPLPPAITCTPDHLVAILRKG